MDNSNIIYERKNADGTVDYIVSLGSILYNNRVLTVSNLVIPIRGKSFFTLPEDKGKYAAVNVYYNTEDGTFLFDLVTKSKTFIQNVTADAVSNHLPIAQFIIQESYGTFKVLVINQYSKMAAFSITKNFVTGIQGAQGPVGDTGYAGYTGSQGNTGLQGLVGYTGPKGVTGVGLQGVTGPQGDTGIQPDLDLLLYAKFKSDDTRLIDYSVYERDFGWGASGAGYTGVGYTGIGLGDTGLFFYAQEASSYEVEDGIVDNCHSITYRGGWSSYKHPRWLGFTGTIQAWIRLDVPPKADFAYEVDPSDNLRYIFTDTSMFYPTSWEWTLGIGSEVIKAQNFSYLFPAHGTYMITLRSSNASGTSQRVRVIIV
jgi:hypothetical protein